MRDWEPEPREGCGGGATSLEREMLVYPTRMFQIAQFAPRPMRDGPSFCVEVTRVPFGLGEEEHEGSVTVLDPCRRKEGDRSTAFSTTDAVDVQNGACL